MGERLSRDDAEHDALLAKHGFPTDAVPRGVRADMSNPGFAFVNRDGVKLRNWICVLDGVIIDGHQGSDLDPGGGCIMCVVKSRRGNAAATAPTRLSL